MADLAQFTAQNKYLMLALDHRESFKKLINPQDPNTVSKEQAIQIKSEIITSLSPQISGLLVDQEYGLPAYKEKTKPFLLPVEKSGFTMQDGERLTQLESTADELKQLGASGIKLLLHFHPDGATAAAQLKTAHLVQDQCKKADLPFFLEVVTYGSKEKKDLVIESLEVMLAVNILPDVFKLEYPGDEATGKKITEMLGERPWILLTGGEDFDQFKVHLKTAIDNGCRGFLAGRALWKEFFQLEGEEKNKFLQQTLPDRFKQLSDIAFSV